MRIKVHAPRSTHHGKTGTVVHRSLEEGVLVDLRGGQFWFDPAHLKPAPDPIENIEQLEEEVTRIENEIRDLPYFGDAQLAGALHQVYQAVQYLGRIAGS